MGIDIKSDRAIAIEAANELKAEFPKETPVGGCLHHQNRGSAHPHVGWPVQAAIEMVKMGRSDLAAHLADICDGLEGQTSFYARLIRENVLRQPEPEKK